MFFTKLESQNMQGKKETILSIIVQTCFLLSLHLNDAFVKVFMIHLKAQQKLACLPHRNGEGGRERERERETSVASRRSANMPASTQTAFNCAPLKSSVDLANSSKLTSGCTFIFLEWICNKDPKRSTDYTITLIQGDRFPNFHNNG